MSLFKEKLELKIEEAEFRLSRTLGSFSPWQKWIILFCLLAALPGYFAAKTIGKQHYAKYYSQFLIQAHPSFSEAKNLIVERTDVAFLGDKEYSLALQIVNPNLDLAAKNISYEIKFLGKNGVEIAHSEKGSFYILPNQRKYLIVPRVYSESNVNSVNLILQNDIVWQKKLDLPQVNILASEPKGKDIYSPFGYELEGGIFNDSPYQIKEVKLTFLLYGAGGKIIGSSQRSEFELKPFERRDYKQIWAGISGRNVIKAETHAETNLLDRANLKAPELEDRGAGDLGR
ncbi:MAG: hypothetical protein HYZ51_01525 [Candidatus Doudnabacteria bacterium]|nr:hypothetical protein [Candidatus Doudnabacteria bacterium]